MSCAYYLIEHLDMLTKGSVSGQQDLLIRGEETIGAPSLGGRIRARTSEEGALYGLSLFPAVTGLLGSSHSGGVLHRQRLSCMPQWCADAPGGLL